MSNGKYELQFSRKIREVGEPCPYIGDCSLDLTSRNDCRGQYERCSELIRRIEQEERI